MLVTYRGWIILIVSGLVAYSRQQEKDPAFMAKFNQYKQDCIKESKVKEDDIKKFWEANKFPSNDKELNCYFKCMNLKLGVMNEAGDVIDDVLKQVTLELKPADLEAEVVAECGAIKGADLCETAFKLLTCIRQAELD